ncbi:hypothetical protein BSN85_38400 [Bradyrhizobium brasilense]|nr:hypothetical protein BSN85_38400 [Bradyrhizobium brasilense]
MSRAFSSEVDTGSREENASDKNLEPFPLRFHRNGKGSRRHATTARPSPARGRACRSPASTAR